MIKYEVLVLVGGKGTRVNKFTKKVPKCLIKFNKKPFLYYQLKYLKNNGIKNVLLSSCYLNKKIETYVRKNINFINVKIVNDGKPLGTGGAVRKSIRFMKKYFFIIYGDSYFNFKLTKLIKNKNVATMAIFKNKNLYDRSNIRLKNGNKIEYFRDTANEELNFIDYGASYVSKSIFVDIKFECIKILKIFSFTLSLRGLVLVFFKKLIDFPFNNPLIILIFNNYFPSNITSVKTIFNF